MAGHGGARKGAGRKPGVLGEAKRKISEMAKEHGESALAVLCEVMTNSDEPASARVSAANAILDRGYGKVPQAIVGGDEDEAPIRVESVSELELARQVAFLLAKGMKASE